MTHPRKVTDEPRVFMTDDARHASPTYQMQPPLEPTDMFATIDQLARSGFDTISWGAGVEGGSMMYPSKVLPMWGESVTLWTHSVWYRCWRNLRSLVDAGYDPFKIMIDRAHAKGIWFFANDWVNFQGSRREVTGGLGRTVDWVYEHPEYEVGPEDDPRADERHAMRFNFLHEEVRQKRLNMYVEFLSYETNGVDLDMVDYAPLCRFDEVDRLKPLMTQWMRDLRAAADAAQDEQGRKKYIWVRIPHHPDAWPAFGYDLPAWVNEGLVNGLICLGGTLHMGIDHSFDVSEAVKLTRGTGCRVLVGQSNWLGRPYAKYATGQMFQAAAANAYAQGARGFGMSDAHWTPSGWPWRDEDYAATRLLGDPDLLATADKHYHARASVGRPAADWIPGAAGRLPVQLEEGVPVPVKLYVSDDLEHWEQCGRVDSVRLSVYITGIEASLNEVRVELNDKSLPDDILDLDDLGYRLHSGGAFGPYGMIYRFDLSAGCFPRRGMNMIEVTLVKRDGRISNPFELYDVDCTVKYRMHRGFQREPMSY